VSRAGREDTGWRQMTGPRTPASEARPGLNGTPRDARPRRAAGLAAWTRRHLAWRRLARELAFAAIFGVIYEELRGHMVQSGSAATSHALSIVSAERYLGMFREQAVQAAFLKADSVVDAFNAYYGGTHFLVPAGVLIWLILRHPGRYGRSRTALAVITGLAFASFWLFPVAPPRLLPGRFGIVDTLRDVGSSGHFQATLIDSAGNQYAAMPSLHIAWAVWCTLAVYPVVRGRALRLLAAVYPVMTSLVVVATGNHFFFDTVAGALLAGVAWAGVTRAGRRIAARTPGNAAPATATSGPRGARSWPAAPGPLRPAVPRPRAGDAAAHGPLVRQLPAPPFVRPVNDHDGSRARRPRAAAVSAHRGGGEDAPAGTYAAYRAALETGAEYVEFDIRRTADAQLVAFHPASSDAGQAVADASYARLCEAAGYEVPRAEDVMRMIAGKAAGHLDLKERGSANLIIERALEILGPGNFVAATTEDACAAAIRERFATVPVALSLGRDLLALPWRRRFSAGLDELRPLPRIRACGASWCAIHQRLARAGVLQQCHRHGIKTMVWTVNSDHMLIRLLADPRVDVVVTDRPRRAITLRDQLLRAAD
jgi:glycerophosphoryl diester phosphodiesterase